jgi:electron transfer flavoprotein beta subunit
MRIIVCAKHVVDSTEIRWDEASGDVLLRNLPTKISDYDRNAIEAAVVLKETSDLVNLGILMVGGEAAQKALKEAVAMGADKGYLVEDGWEDPFDPMRTARVLAKAVAELGEVDVVMCGLVSEDGYSGVTGPALAQLLDMPYIAPVVSLKVGADDGRVNAVIDAGSVRRTVEVPPPCVLGIDSPINVPRLPTVLQVMKVKSDRVGHVSLADLGLGQGADELTCTTAVVGRRSGAVDRKRTVIEGSARESALRLVEALRQEGVL